MRVIAAFIIIICLNTTAKIYAQTISLTEINSSLETVFKKVEKQTDYHFLYAREVLAKGKKVNISFKNIPLNEALSRVFADQALDFIIYNKQIVIKEREILPDKDANLIIKPEETYAITGIVTDEKGEPLPSATVFIANSQKATPTDESGKFTLPNVAPGTYDVVVKMLGFSIYNHLITIQKKSVDLNIKLQENVIALQTVQITALSAFERENYMSLFVKYFIGESENADKCTLLNPEAVNLNFDKANKVLEATSDEFLVVKNKSLGYEVHYLLTDFKMDLLNQLLSYDGVLYFKELEGGKSQKEKWARNRQLTYEGSIWHFFKAAYNNTLAKEGFYIYKLPDVEANDKVRQTDFKRISPLVNTDTLFTRLNGNFKLFNLAPLKADSSELYIIYTKKNESDRYIKSSGIQIVFKNSVVPYELGRAEQLPFKMPYSERQITIIHPVLDSMLFDKNGNILPEKAILPRGYWSWERIADLFPPDFNTQGAAQQKIPLVKEIKTIISAADTVRAKLPVEKLYLQTDRSNYIINDTLHFKSYLLDADFLTPSYRSGLLYVELDDTTGVCVKRIMVPVSSGISWGDMALNDTQLSDGTYTIRAYTNWARNFGDNYIFKKDIYLAKVSVTKTPKADINLQEQGETIDMQFMPEGGNIIAGIPTRIGFKAVDEKGKGAFISGTVYNDQKQKVSSFKSSDNGIGSFELIPQNGETYTVNAVLPGNISKAFMLPKVSTAGTALRIDNKNKDSLLITLTGITGIVTENNTAPATYYLIGQARGVICYASLINFNQQTVRSTVAKSLFPTGITRFSLLGADRTPVNERMVYIDHGDDMRITINPNKAEYSLRDSIALTIAVTDADGKPMQGTFSVAVTDDSQVKTDSIDNYITNNLLLTSDLKGTIEQPDYYFEDNTSQKITDLDNLMLTQRWAGYTWKQIFEPIRPEFKAEDAFTVKGKVLDIKGVAQAKATVRLLSQNPPLLKDTIADKNGDFIFKGIFPVDSAMFKLQATSRNGTNLVIKMNEFMPPQFNSKHRSSVPSHSVMLEKRDVGQLSELNYIINNLRQLMPGAISISTNPAISRTYLYNPLAFTLPVPFYRPGYAAPNNTAIGTDTRATIHWEPNMVTDAAGKATISFFSADKPTDYTIIIQGTDLNGDIGYKKQKIKVVAKTIAAK